jgi:hypothetical protein
MASRSFQVCNHHRIIHFMRSDFREASQLGTFGNLRENVYSSQMKMARLDAHVTSILRFIGIGLGSIAATDAMRFVMVFGGVRVRSCNECAEARFRAAGHAVCA